MDERKPTTLEWLLYAWLCLNTFLGLRLLLEGLYGQGYFTIYGSGWTVGIPLIFGLSATAILLWRLLTPTWINLGFAAGLYLLQTIVVLLPGRAYGFQLGICVNYLLIDDPGYIVKINLLAIVGAALYGVAAYWRFDEQKP